MMAVLWHTCTLHEYIMIRYQEATFVISALQAHYAVGMRLQARALKIPKYTMVR